MEWRSVFFFQAEDGIRDAQESRGLGDVYKRQTHNSSEPNTKHSQLITLTEILKAEHNYKDALLYTEHSRHLADSIIDESRRMDLFKIEKRYNNQRLENINQRLEYSTQVNHYIIILISLVAIIITIGF